MLVEAHAASAELVDLPEALLDSCKQGSGRNLSTHSGRRSLHGIFPLPRRSRRRTLSLLESGACVRVLLGTCLLLGWVAVGKHVSRSLLDLLLRRVLALFHSNPSVRRFIDGHTHPSLTANRRGWRAQ
jgi:hypothetical protein